MPTIETMYRCCLYFEDRTAGNSKTQDEIMARAFQLSYRERNVDIEAFEGCPAAGPCITLESEDRTALERLAGKIERYISKRKNVVLLP